MMMKMISTQAFDEVEYESVYLDSSSTNASS